MIYIYIIYNVIIPIYVFLQMLPQKSSILIIILQQKLHFI